LQIATHAQPDIKEQAMLLTSIFSKTRWNRKRKMCASTGLTALFLGVLMSVTLPAEAACTQTGDGLKTFGLGAPYSVVIPRNASVGSVIATLTTGVGRSYIQCDAAGGTIGLSVPDKGGRDYIPNAIEPTDTPGIGYTVTSTGVINGDWTTRAHVTQKDVSQNGIQITVKLIKTGPITLSSTGKVFPVSGPSGSLNWVGIYPDGAPYSNWAAVRWQGVFGSVSLIDSGCTVAIPSIAVPLPTTTIGQLNRMDPNAGLKAFNIGVNCESAGTRVGITMTDNNNPGNTSNKLSLSTGSTATGVQLQILNNGTPINFGLDSATIGNAGSFDIGTSSVGQMNVPLAVRYVKTADSVTPGTINALATFTLNYQ
jgi:type 1 fimbria pilin